MRKGGTQSVWNKDNSNWATAHQPSLNHAPQKLSRLIRLAIDWRHKQKQKRWRGASHRDIAASWQNKQVVIPSMCECGLAEQPCDAQPTHGARHIRVLDVHHLLLLWILRGLDFVLQEGRAIFGGELLVHRVQDDLDFFSLPLHLYLSPSTISPVRRCSGIQFQLQPSQTPHPLTKPHLPLGCKPHLKPHRHNGT